MAMNLRGVVLLWLALFGIGALASAQPSAAPKVVLVLPDDMGWADLG
jgi:hypothetical protein